MTRQNGATDWQAPASLLTYCIHQLWLNHLFFGPVGLDYRNKNLVNVAVFIVVDTHLCQTAILP